MMKYNYLKYFVLLFYLVSQTSCSQDLEVYSIESAIEEGHRIIDSIQQSSNVPGIDVAVYLDGKIVWSEAFGFADLAYTIPVKAGETQFRIGSVSKSLTAAALGVLMDSGKLNLDLPIQTYVSYFPEKKYPITVKQVAGHMAGIRHYNGSENYSKKYYSSVKSGISIFSNDELLFEPGTRFSYSSYGYNLLSAAIEGASGEDFLTYMQRVVFSPLEMHSTCADKNDSLIINRTSFYIVKKQKAEAEVYVDNSYKWAGGGFLSTTTDLINFGVAHLQPSYLSDSTLNILTTSQELSNGAKTNYGIGWSCYSDGFRHTGASIGGITYFGIYTDANLVFVLLSNASNSNYKNVEKRIVNLFLKTQK